MFHVSRYKISTENLIARYGPDNAEIDPSWELINVLWAPDIDITLACYEDQRISQGPRGDIRSCLTTLNTLTGNWTVNYIVISKTGNSMYSTIHSLYKYKCCFPPFWIIKGRVTFTWLHTSTLHMSCCLPSLHINISFNSVSCPSLACLRIRRATLSRILDSNRIENINVVYVLCFCGLQAATRPDNSIRIIDINRDNYTDRSLTVPRSSYDLPLKPIIGAFIQFPSIQN